MNRATTQHEHAGDFVRAAVADYQTPLIRYAARLIGDADRARDVVQGHLAEWLFTVCRHRALDILRKEGRMKRFEEGQMERVSTAEPRPGKALEYSETHEAILRLIGTLPANQQEVIRLKFQNGFSYKEISRITALSVSHVGVLIHHAVTRLRAEFAAQQP
jgi:RNA polymerase sigma factor (sigma-70 family)